MIPDKFKETGWQTTAIGTVLGTFYVGAVSIGTLMGNGAAETAGALAEHVEVVAAVILPMIFGGAGYRAIRMQQKRTTDRIRKSVPAPQTDGGEEEEGPWD